MIKTLSALSLLLKYANILLCYNIALKTGYYDVLSESQPVSRLIFANERKSNGNESAGPCNRPYGFFGRGKNHLIKSHSYLTTW